MGESSRLSTGYTPQRRGKWQGVTVPMYPAGAGYHPRQPCSSQIQNALAHSGPEVWRIWVQRLRLLNPARWAALQSAFQSGRKLWGIRYSSAQPCCRCGGLSRTAVFNRCASCYSGVRFNTARKHSEEQLVRAEYQRQQMESRSCIPCVVAGSGSSWVAFCDADGVRFWHPTKTQRVLRHLEPILHDHYMQHDPQYRDLFLWAVENQPLPEWASVMHES